VEGGGSGQRGMEVSENGKGRKRSKTKRKRKKEKGIEMEMNGEILESGEIIEKWRE
jgi:hypothetical protein